MEEKISGSILSEDEIADSASPELADIRRHIRAAAGKVRDVLNRLISSNQSKYLQESINTMRGGRYVVPVKSEHKNEIPGLVHDVSGSGGTFFIEPMGVVNANNELRELQMKEQKEIERILAELSADCAGFREGIEDNYRTLIALDVIFARAKLSTHMGGMEPVLGDYIELKKARHPLLDPKTAVHNDLYLGRDFDTLVITGPNTGGKTVTLKTLGLLTLMAQCGLHIPAMDGSTIRVCSAVLADIGDEQSIDQSLSTFSSHMVNIVAMLEQLDEDTLVLFDELGAGTDPVEGAALAAAIIESARQLGARVAATTHYAELKVYAMTTQGVENASCEFNVDTLAPTYRVLIGIPGKSNAFAISRRLGLPDYIIQRAADRIDAETADITIWKRHIRDVLNRPDSIVSYGDPQGEPALREALAAYAYRARGVKADPEQIVIGAGIQPLLTILCGLLPQKKIAMDGVGFLQAERAFDDCGVETVRLPGDQEGLDLSALEKSGVKQVMVSPSAPTGQATAMPPSRRFALLQWAGEQDGLILEDDYNGPHSGAAGLRAGTGGVSGVFFQAAAAQCANQLYGAAAVPPDPVCAKSQSL